MLERIFGRKTEGDEATPQVKLRMPHADYLAQKIEKARAEQSFNGELTPERKRALKAIGYIVKVLDEQEGVSVDLKGVSFDVLSEADTCFALEITCFQTQAKRGFTYILSKPEDDENEIYVNELELVQNVFRADSAKGLRKQCVDFMDAAGRQSLLDQIGDWLIATRREHDRQALFRREVLGAGATTKPTQKSQLKVQP
jgi:hypothetical protein